MSEAKYPYDISYLRWNGHGDNAAPERGATDFAKDWNATYTWPKLVVSSTSEAFAAFEKRYGSKIPEVRSEWAPLWEDGAGSSALETALNRNSAERLEQAQTIYAIRDPRHYPANGICRSLESRSVVFRAHLGIGPEYLGPGTSADPRSNGSQSGTLRCEADRRSRELLSKALGASTNREIDVYNTCCWTRTEVVSLTPEQSTGGDRVLDDHGNAGAFAAPLDGELCFLARDIPGLGARRFKVVAGQAPTRHFLAQQ